MICCSSWISTQKRTPSGVAAPDGVFLLVLTALAHQAVKPLTEIVCNDLCCNSLEKGDEIFHKVHLLSATGGSEKGRRPGIT